MLSLDWHYSKTQHFFQVFCMIRHNPSDSFVLFEFPFQTLQEYLDNKSFIYIKWSHWKYNFLGALNINLALCRKYQSEFQLWNISNQKPCDNTSRDVWWWWKKLILGFVCGIYLNQKPHRRNFYYYSFIFNKKELPLETRKLYACFAVPSTIFKEC